MRIYTLKIDPETNHIDIEDEVKEHLVKRQDKDFYYLQSGKRICKKADFTVVFLNENDAEDFRISELRTLKKIFRENLRKVNVQLQGDHIRKYTKPLKMVKVIPVNGDEPVICTARRAMEITGLSRPGVCSSAKRGSKCHSGFYIENID